MVLMLQEVQVDFFKLYLQTFVIIWITLIEALLLKQWLSEYDDRVDILENTLNECIRKNSYLGENENDKYINGFQNIEGLYSQELADKVVELATEVYFKQIGYSIDSWKS